MLALLMADCSLQATNGSLTSINTHMKGLQRLIALRGGLQADINPFTKRLILWCAVNCLSSLLKLTILAGLT